MSIFVSISASSYSFICIYDGIDIHAYMTSSICMCVFVCVRMHSCTLASIYACIFHSPMYAPMFFDILMNGCMVVSIGTYVCMMEST